SFHFVYLISLCWIFDFTFFFFSSRRRHTRWPRDWSSDVCSSDLLWRVNDHTKTVREIRRHSRVDAEAYEEFSKMMVPMCRFVKRSEERRVGKECRSRWWACHLEKKEKSDERDRRN